MKNCVYLAAEQPPPEGLPFAQTGFGFLPDGRLRAPEPCAALLVLNDRQLPSERGLEEAVSFFASAACERLICDFERAFDPLLARLAAALDPARLVLPPQYRALPHAALFPPPFLAQRDFDAWKDAWGEALVLDHMPLCLRAVPGSPPQRLPFSGLPRLRPRQSLGLGCHYGVSACGGGAVFWLYDTPQSYLARAERAGCPCLVPAEEYRALTARR